MNKISDLKKELKKLRKSIKDYKPHSKERKEAKRLIAELKASIQALQTADLGKKPLVEAILKLDPLAKKLNINLYAHSIENLKIHLKKIKEKYTLDK